MSRHFRILALASAAITAKEDAANRTLSRGARDKAKGRYFGLILALELGFDVSPDRIPDLSEEFRTGIVTDAERAIRGPVAL